MGDTTFFAALLAADQSQYIMGAHTSSAAGTDTTTNICNIPNKHVYSILAVLNIKAENGT